MSGEEAVRLEIGRKVLEVDQRFARYAWGGGGRRGEKIFSTFRNDASSFCATPPSCTVYSIEAFRGVSRVPGRRVAFEMLFRDAIVAYTRLFEKKDKAG